MRSFKQWLVDWLYPAFEYKRLMREWRATREMPRCSACVIVLARSAHYCHVCGTPTHRERHTSSSLTPISPSMMLRAVRPGDLWQEYRQETKKHLTGKLPNIGEGSKR